MTSPLNTSQTRLADCESVGEDECRVYFTRTPLPSVSSFGCERINSGSLESGVSGVRCNEFDDVSIEDEWSCRLNGRAESVISTSALSLSGISPVSGAFYSQHCKQTPERLKGRKAGDARRKPVQKPLQVSLSLPIYSNGSYSDPRELVARTSWFVDLENPRALSLNSPRVTDANTNNNSNNEVLNTIEVAETETEAANATANSASTVASSNQLHRAIQKRSRLEFCGNKGLCILVIVLVLVTAATGGALVYFVVFSKHPHDDQTSGISTDNPDDAKPPPFSGNLSLLLNQTYFCGAVPSRYLPSGVTFPPQAVYLSSIELNSSSATRQLNATNRVVGGTPTNIAQYPWQKRDLYFPARLAPDVSRDAIDVRPAAPPVIIRKTRVIGGVPVTNQQVPWMVALYYKDNGLLCGGSVILKNWIISAVHCFVGKPNPNDWTAYAGVSSLPRRYQHPAEHRRLIRILTNPGYHTSIVVYDYDIALLELESDLTFSKVIQPICIPPQSYNFPVGMHCYVSGWGVTNNQGRLPTPSVLQHAQVDVISNDTCNRWLHGQVTDRMMCAGKPEGGQDSCQGDSGGPLSCFVEERGVWMVAGSVSWGIECGRPKLPGVYAKISHFTDWIWTRIGEIEGLIPTTATSTI